MRKFTTKSQKIGEIGEDIACKALFAKDFSILERNYTRKCGEIDIIARKNGKIHFIEVKSVSYETDFNPEENLHAHKIDRIVKTSQLYLLENNVSYETNWQIDALIVRIDSDNFKAKVKVLENINL